MNSFKQYFFLIPFMTILFISCSDDKPIDNTLRSDIKKITSKSDGHIGVALLDLQTGDTLSINDNYHYPMQSVYKFPLALKVLSLIDSGKYSLNQNIFVTKDDLHQNTWSPLTKKYPEGNVDVPLSELIRVTVAESDNNACDILFRLAGGPSEVNSFIHGLGVDSINIVSTEAEMHADQDLQYKNWCNPSAMSSLLGTFAADSILSDSCYQSLWDTMISDVYHSKRIKGELPEGTVVAHKTGTSDVDENGVAAAANNAGIIVLPDGRKLALTVFVSGASGTAESRDKTIADIARKVWDWYISENN